MRESRRRTLVKTISWRVVAVLNSYVALITFSQHGDLFKAVAMNVSGFLIYYLFERTWNGIGWGKYKDDVA